MSTSFTYSKKLGGFDISIWLVMAGAVLLSGILFGFKLFKPVELSPLTIIVVGDDRAARENNEFRVGERIYLNVSGAAEPTVSWDFGDGETTQSNDHIEHIYSAIGAYTVTVTSSGGKQQAKIEINIKESGPNLKWTLDEINSSVQGPQQVHAGDIMNFSTSITADAYEWTIEGKPEYGVSKEQGVSYSIIREGVYYVSLILNNDVKTKTIRPVKVTAPKANVVGGLDDGELPAPMPTIIQPRKEGETNEKVYQQVPDELFQKFLNKVIEKQMTMKEFDEYLCDGDQTKVKVNDEIMTFGEFFQTLQQKRGLVGRVIKGKPKIKTVKQVRQEGCVTILYVTL